MLFFYRNDMGGKDMSTAHTLVPCNAQRYISFSVLQSKPAQQVPAGRKGALDISFPPIFARNEMRSAELFTCFFDRNRILFMASDRRSLRKVYRMVMQVRYVGGEDMNVAG